MSKDYSSSNEQFHLNLAHYQAQCAENLTTSDVSHLIELLAQQEISQDDVLQRAKEGHFTIPYSYGRLIFTLSRRGKQGQPYLLNMEFLPASYTESRS